MVTEHILAAMEPIWRMQPETAARVRGRVESVFDYAKARGWRDGENPATWRGHLVKLLPFRAEVAPVQHHAALPWTEIGAFMALLRAQQGLGARILEFAILTAGRSGEVLGTTWGEIDLAGKSWTMPAAQMKAKRKHRVPLSEPALAMLEQMKEARMHEGAGPTCSREL